MFQISKRGIVKYAMHTLVGAVAAQVTETAITTVIDPEDDGNVELASNIVATGVVMATWKRTDRLVDNIADWRVARKEAKNSEPAPAAV